MQVKSKAIGILALVLLVVMLSMIGCDRIGVGHVGLVVDLAGSQRGVQDFTLRTGWVFYNRFATQVVEYPTFVQTAIWTKDPHEGDNPAYDGSDGNEEITFTTRDSMVVKADFNVSYLLDAPKVPAFYVKFRSDDLKTFTHGYFKNAARNCINEVAGGYQVEQIMGDNGPFIKAAEKCLQADVLTIGVLVQQFGITGAPRPPEQVTQNINMKVQASQIALQKDNEVAQSKAEALKKVAEAEGDANSVRARAKGDADAVVMKAEAQKKSNELINASLTPMVLERTRLDMQWHQIDAWAAGGARVPETVLSNGQGMIYQLPPVQPKQ